jgi:hypothetical protein
LERDHKLAPEEALENIMALEKPQPNGGSIPPSPYLNLGRVLYKGLPTHFLAIWMLDSHECCIIFDPDTDDGEIPEERIPCTKRVEKFPGTESELSIGNLSGLFEGQQLTLQVKGANGFYIRDVELVDRKIKAFDWNRSDRLLKQTFELWSKFFVGR